MNSTAKAYWLGLKRSDGFIRFFSSELEGDDWFKQPCGAPNPAIWILGHLAHSRATFLEMLTGQRMYEEGWDALAGLGVDPQDASVYPDVDTCRRVLAARLRDLKSYLETASEADLDGPPCVSSKFFKTKAAVLVQLSHHEAHHTGALSMLRRLLGKERII